MSSVITLPSLSSSTTSKSAIAFSILAALVASSVCPFFMNKLVRVRVRVRVRVGVRVRARVRVRVLAEMPQLVRVRGRVRVRLRHFAAHG